MKTEIVIDPVPGKADYQSIQAGIDYLGSLPNSTKKTLIIREGLYREYIECRLSNFQMLGQGEVQIIGYRSAKQKLSSGEERETFRTATVFLEGENVHIENLQIINQAGAGDQVGQAVALFNYAHHVRLVNCRLSGQQDTLCTGPLPPTQKDGRLFLTPVTKERKYCRQYYERCWIEGTIDFIFGGADAVFDHCIINSLPCSSNGYITAASTTKEQEQGFYFYACAIVADVDVSAVYLGRPWRSYAQVTFEKCEIGAHVHQHGWHDWDEEKNRHTARFYERNNRYQGWVCRDAWLTIEKGENR
ncbi:MULTISPECIES: pectinesterase family protein [Enterococcus]|uniref:Pectinesterase n=1 Tax=Candidatus Enterococcus mangumiae TaxID=2230878 RepID=A0ABZ2SU81_9ENTE|nr:MULTISPECIES: pectinesterase family protein [unclassified Enterococcus]MBO0460873.1 pectin esterase [Enterococcus sp. DIV1298c]MBO0488893.1 pectin esterase [Enterococcus sp. DIV1094]MBO1298628.1 pectin esterase [Enterococcus sp. DIV1271a]